MVEAFFDHASGIRIVLARGVGNRPARTRTSNTASSAAKVGAAGLNDGPDVVAMAAEQLKRHLEFVILHPVAGNLQPIDLTPIRRGAKRLGKPPGGVLLSEISLMKNGGRRHKSFVGQVGMQIGKLLREEASLVNQRAVGGRESEQM